MYNKMVVNPKTGFLEQPNYLPAFDSDKKLRLLDYLEKQPFKISFACEAVGVDTATFYKHLVLDATFAQQIQKLKTRRIEEVEQKLADMATVKEQVADRIFFLKSWKQDRYNPIQRSESTIRIEIDTSSVNAAMERDKALDAQIENRLQSAVQIPASSVEEPPASIENVPPRNTTATEP